MGVGGIFFNGPFTPDLESSFKVLVDCCESIIPCYMPLVEKHAQEKYTEREKQWQQLRRGRYVFSNYITSTLDNKQCPDWTWYICLLQSTNQYVCLSMEMLNTVSSRHLYTNDFYGHSILQQLVCVRKTEFIHCA